MDLRTLDEHVLNYLNRRGYSQTVELLKLEAGLVVNADDNFLSEWFQVLNECKQSEDFSNHSTQAKTNQLQDSYQLLAIEQRKLHKTQSIEQDKLKTIASRSSSTNIPNPHNFSSE